MRSSGFSATFTPSLMARKVTPLNIVMEMIPIIPSVVAAFLDLGLRKAGTPLEMASTPVSAVQPEAKARRARKMTPAAPSSPSSGVIS